MGVMSAPWIGGVTLFTEPDGSRFVYLFDTSKIEENLVEFEYSIAFVNVSRCTVFLKLQ